VDASKVAATLPRPGDTLAGKYAIVGVIGEGGMGVVYEATHLRLRRRVAVKVLLPNLLDVSSDMIARFEREARAAAHLRNRHVARVLDVDVTTDGLPYLVMEYLEGHDLDTELTQRGQLPIEEAVGYVLQACAAMAEAHAAGIVHRDLKPSNLFLCPEPDGRLIKVLDFGISKTADEADARLTGTQTSMGTPVYMSPEQVRSSRNVDARTDIWSLGVILYELLAGRTPFLGSTTAAAAAIVADPAPPLREFRSNVPPELETVIHCALSKDPNGRYDTVIEFARAITPFGDPQANSQPISAPPSLEPVSSPYTPAPPAYSKSAGTLVDARSNPGSSIIVADGPIATRTSGRPPARWEIAVLGGAGALVAIGIAISVLARPRARSPSAPSVVQTSVSVESAMAPSAPATSAPVLSSSAPAPEVPHHSFAGAPPRPKPAPPPPAPRPASGPPPPTPTRESANPLFL
jgi:eukaryotic-like serine/threonine-protein kinase